MAGEARQRVGKPPMARKGPKRSRWDGGEAVWLTEEASGWQCLKVADRRRGQKEWKGRRRRMSGDLGFEAKGGAYDETHKYLKVFSLFKDFMIGITKFEELVSIGNTFLNGFQQALEFLRWPPIDITSQLVKNVIQSNETKRFKSYIEAGCINTDVIGNGILNELECLLEYVRAAMQDISLFQDDNLSERSNEQACISDREEFAKSCPRRNEMSDYAILMAVIYGMVKQEHMMQERVVSAISLRLCSGELDSYCLMLSLRPYIDEEILGRAWKLIR